MDAAEPQTAVRRGACGAVVLACAWVALLAWSTSPALASSHVEVAELDGITATFTYQLGRNQFGGESTSSLTMTIARAGGVVYSAPVTSRACGSECSVAYEGPDVHVATLEPGQEPEVVLDLFTGGAHCCFIEQVFSGPSANGVTVAERDFGNVRGRLQPLGPAGTDVFVSVDNRFAYAFTDYADSGLPVQVWGFSHGEFIDVTGAFPELIARDAVAQWRYFKARRNNDVGFFAAWAADQERLGHAALVARALGRELHAHRLNAAIGPDHGQRFAHDLKTDLRRWGYLVTCVGVHPGDRQICAVPK